jgi:hypothetical protein
MTWADYQQGPRRVTPCVCSHPRRWHGGHRQDKACTACQCAAYKRREVAA